MNARTSALSVLVGAALCLGGGAVAAPSGVPGQPAPVAKPAPAVQSGAAVVPAANPVANGAANSAAATPSPPASADPVAKEYHAGVSTPVKVYFLLTGR